METTNDELTDLRLLLDIADQKLLTALSERLQLVERIGILKAEKGIPPLDEARWQVVLQTRTEKGAALGLSPEFVTAIFNTIHTEALRIEARIASVEI